MPVEIKSEKSIPDKLFFTLSDNSASFEIYTFGATVTSWKVKGTEQLHLSSKAIMDGSKAIRGGIPLVFPQFGKGPNSPQVQHGFARVSRWSFLGLDKDTPTEIVARFGLDSDNETVVGSFQKWFPYKFRVVYTVKLSNFSLSGSFSVWNMDKAAFEFTALLHTYFAVEDISKITILGLQGREYHDKVKDVQVKEDRLEVGIDGEVDAVYKDAAESDLSINDQSRCLLIKSTGFRDAVVWNPWIEKANAMSDFDADGYKRMVCVEMGTVAAPVKLEPGQEWFAEQTVHCKYK